MNGIVKSSLDNTIYTMLKAINQIEFKTPLRKGVNLHVCIREIVEGLEISTVEDWIKHIKDRIGRET